MQEALLEGLRRLDIIFASATVLIAFSLLAYLSVNNFRSPVARAFVALLAFVTLVYVGDVFLSTARLDATHPAAGFWLRFQWLGIAFVAPAYLHFSNTLLETTGDVSPTRKRAVVGAYAAAAAVLVAALTTPWIVDVVVGGVGAVRLTPGPGYAGFMLAYLAQVAAGTRYIWRARARTLTRRSHRRMTYLLVSVIAPLSAYPWLITGMGPLAGHPTVFRTISALGNFAIATMLVFVAYSVAYHGVLTPERAVKRELVKYLIQAPMLGMFVIAMTLVVPVRLKDSLGLPRDVVLILAMVFGIVVFQLGVRLSKPVIDFLIYGHEGRDANWLRRLDERLLTNADMAQLLENILAAMCDRLRVTTGCVVALREGQPQVDVYTGDRAASLALIASIDATALGTLAAETTFVTVGGWWVHPLRPAAGGNVLGLLALEAPPRALTADESAAFDALIASTEQALEDRVIQQRVIAALRDLEPELADIQRLRGSLEFGGGAQAAIDVPSPARSPDFPHWVRDALAHYWGGPKLTDSPLLRLNVVRDALEQHEFNTAKAMRDVLDQALDRLKPDGERSLSASQWMVYNILELKFVRGLKVRDIAQRMAMSESDLYRKQRVAIEALARQLLAMETGQPADRRGDPSPPTTPAPRGT